jgi:hypothetical protein
MIDALLFAFRDTVRTLRGFMEVSQCDIVADPDGRPPANMGDWFAAIHPGSVHSDMDNALDEYFGVNVTVTMAVTAPIDRVGDQQMAKLLAAQPGPGRTPSFDVRCNRIASLLHMDWQTMAAANNYLVAMLPEAPTVYGFAEPARYRGGATDVQWGYDEWVSAEEESDGEGKVCIHAMLRFEDCRRLQAIAAFS